ncbi:hypothetical protein BCR43DRAFT_493066 [Syncephalastrum racemosum]|uniref:SAP domain-containing protein n=1 Tax=Syncephalastrum racemosum TaxID=13706 RepID=A0A1X2HA12_SYNRA|nr:hypothetical protein BCR43DRAFT_493066 [Syncephalastrum racemosum]
MNIIKLNWPRVQRLYYSTRPWSNTYLRKLKKTQLESLARENNLSPKGTKAQLITRLLDRPPASTQKQDPPQPEPAQRAKAQPQEQVQEVDAVEDEALDPQRWMESFELKVNQKRRTREAKAESFFPGSNTSARQERKKVTPPPVPDDIPEDMDIQWVKALEQKAANRSMRIRTDTLHATDTSTDHLVSQLHKGDNQPASTQSQARPAMANETPVAETPTTEDQIVRGEPIKADSNANDLPEEPKPAENASREQQQEQTSSSTEPRKDFATAAVGSGLLFWYVSGANGIHSLINWLTGSS